jgi:hypothetical protein
MVQRAEAPSLIEVILVDFPRSTVNGLGVRKFGSERRAVGERGGSHSHSVRFVVG